MHEDHLKNTDARSSKPPLALLPWLLLLPLLALAWPFPSLVSGDFATIEHTALGLAALASLPLGLFLAWQRRLPSTGSMALLLALFIPANFAKPSDSLEFDRAMLTALVAVLVLNAGSLLSDADKQRFARGLVVLSILLLVPALFEGAPGWGGVLENSGELSGAALPGALCGLVLWSRSTRVWQWIGMTALGLFLLHAIFAPVLAALVVLALVAMALTLLGRGADTAQRIRCLTTFILALGALGLLKWTPIGVSSNSTDGSATNIEAPTRLGGIEVRERIWLASLDMLREHMIYGVGAGQFAVEFPAFRDPHEQLLSNWKHEIEASTEVEHPHNDWILPWTEGGVLAGIIWWAFLFSVLRACLQGLRRPDASGLALAAAAFGGLFAAGVNAPLFFNPCASVALFALFGSVLGQTTAARRADAQSRFRIGRFLVGGLVLLLLLYAPRARDLVAHGQALARLANSTTDTERGEAIEAAVASLPDSVVALTLEARLLEQRDGDLEAALKVWERVLKLRPLRFEAWMQRGVLLARLGRLDEAQDSFERASELDPTQPDLMRNRARLAASADRAEDCLVEIEQLVASGVFDALWLRDLACEQILAGRMATGQVLLTRADERFADLSGERAWALDEEYRLSGSRKAADAFRTLANWLWAQEHAESGNWGDARRAYFQALRIQRDYVQPAGPKNIRVQQACTLWFAGQRAEAAESIQDIELGEINWATCPVWCREALYGLSGS